LYKNFATLRLYFLKNVMKKFYRLLCGVFAEATVEQLAQRELDRACKALLDAQSQLDYQTAMCRFYKKRIESLLGIPKETP
jgi:hypothetical protein